MHFRAVLQEQFNALLPQKTLVILHPYAYKMRHNLISEMLPSNTIYITMPPTIANLDDFWGLLAQEFATQAQLALPNGNPDAKTLSETINGLESLTLLIDDYDHVDDGATHRFVHDIATTLKPQRRIIIWGRRLSQRLISMAQHAPYSSIIPVDTSELMVDYIHTDADSTLLEVRALGANLATIDGRLLEQWDGVLPRNLFCFLVDRAMTTRDEIFDSFWPTMPTKEATNVFHVTKRKIRDILGQDLVQYGSGYYRIRDDIMLHYDVVAFQNAVQNAEMAAIANQSDEAKRLYYRALRLYRGHFSSATDLPWGKSRRQELQLVFTDALTGLARLHQDEGDLRLALHFYLRASANQWQREDIVRDMMTLYDTLGEPQRALVVYEQLRGELDRRLKITPAPETKALAAQIQAKI